MEIDRREALQYLFWGVVSLLPAPLAIAFTPLAHPKRVGFSYSADESRDEHGLEGDRERKLFEELCQRFTDNPYNNWVRLCFRQNKKADDNLRDLSFQYETARRYNLSIYQSIGAEQPFYPNHF